MYDEKSLYSIIFFCDRQVSLFSIFLNLVISLRKLSIRKTQECIVTGIITIQLKD